MLEPGRTFATTSAYRYGFNGKEQDSILGGGVDIDYNYGFRIYDARAGRFLSIDPLTEKYPELSTYQYASNSPISFIDLDGLEAVYRMPNGSIYEQRPSDHLITPIPQDVLKNGTPVGGTKSELNLHNIPILSGFGHDVVKALHGIQTLGSGEVIGGKRNGAKANTNDYLEAIGNIIGLGADLSMVGDGEGEGKIGGGEIGKPKEINTGETGGTQPAIKNTDANKVQGAATRVTTHGANWQEASLNSIVTEFTPGSVGVDLQNGKIEYTNSQTGNKVLYDKNSNYFRIFDRKGHAVELNGKQPNAGKLTGEDAKAFKLSRTHFKNTDPK